MADAARLAEELRSEQDHGMQVEKNRKTLESQLKELQVRLDEAEASAMKGGKRQLAKLEQRVSSSIVHLQYLQYSARSHTVPHTIVNRTKKRVIRNCGNFFSVLRTQKLILMCQILIR